MDHAEEERVVEGRSVRCGCTVALWWVGRAGLLRARLWMRLASRNSIQVILMTHEPLWLLEWFWHSRRGANLRQLVRGHLRGRARLHLAGERLAVGVGVGKSAMLAPGTMPGLGRKEASGGDRGGVYQVMLKPFPSQKSRG